MKCGKITRYDLGVDRGVRPTCDVCGERRASYKDYRYIRYELTRFLTCGICSQLPDDEFTSIVQARET